MKILAISDFHGEVGILSSLERTVRELEPHVITFTGDVVKGFARGDEWQSAKSQKRKPVRDRETILREREEDVAFYEMFYDALEEIGVPVMAIPGNMDAPEERFRTNVVNRLSRSVAIRIVHQRSVKFGDFHFSGIGGEITEKESEKYFVLQYSRAEVNRMKERIAKGKKKIMLFHSPPFGELGMERGKQKGSGVVNDLVSEFQPQFLFVGHAHTARGTEMLGETLVVNPGALKYGYFALVDTDSREAKLQTLKF